MMFGLVRVSSKTQNNDSQLKQLKEFGVPAENIFTETISGVTKSDNRPVLIDLLSRLRKGDKLVVCRLDRLARSMSELLSLVETLQAKGVDFVSLHEDIRTDTPQGVLVFHIFCSVAEFQRSLIKQSQRAGIDACLDAGKPYGRPRIADTKVEMLDYAIHLYKDTTKSTRDIAKATGISRNTLYRTLQARGIDKRTV